MGRLIHNQTATSSDANVLGMYFQQDNGVYGRSGQQNQSFGFLNRNTSGGTNIWNGWTGATGYTIKKSNSYLRLRFCAIGDHGSTWRAGNLLIKFSTDNWSSNTNIGGFGITVYADGHENYGDGGCFERTWTHGLSVGTVIKFALQDSAHSNGQLRVFNNVHDGGESEGFSGNNFGQVWGMNLKVEEIEQSVVSAMSSQNTFATGG